MSKNVYCNHVNEWDRGRLICVDCANALMEHDKRRREALRDEALGMADAFERMAADALDYEAEATSQTMRDWHEGRHSAYDAAAKSLRKRINDV